MPTPRVISILDPAQLLERAVDGLFPLAPASEAEPWPTLSAWVVLRQGGLRDDLHRLAAARGVAGWFGSPICLFNEIGARWSITEPLPPLTEPERLAIISGIVDRDGGTLFRGKAGSDAWVPAVDRLLGELVSEGISPEDYLRVARDGATDDFAHDRADAIARMYGAWLRTLDDAKRSDGRDARIRLAADLTAHPAEFSARLEGRRDIRLVGLADLRGGWRQLLAALASSPALDRLEILTSFPLALPVELNATLEQPVSVPSFAGSLFSNDSGDASGVHLLEAPDAAREVELTALRVRALIDDGVAPTSIAVIARQARPLVNEVLAALSMLGVPVTARRRTTLAHTAPARALRALLAAASERWSRHTVIEIAEHPLLSTGLDANVLNFVGFARQMDALDDWQESLVELQARCEARERGEEDEEYRRARLPASSEVAKTIAAWEAATPRLAAIAIDRSLAAWFSWVSETLSDGAWGIAERLEKPIADREAWNGDMRARDLIDQHSRSWAQALSTFGADDTPLDAAAFALRLQLLLEQDLVTPPETDFGVVVAEALAAGWRSFEHVFVLGLSAGIFPQRPASSGLLDREDRLALVAGGLPFDAPDAWRDRERELFRVICASARTQLTLSWPVMDNGGRDVARSAYADEAAATLARALKIEDKDDDLASAGVLERVPTNESLVPGFPVAASADAIEHARIVAARETARSEAPTPWNGLVESPELTALLAARYGESYTWSATQLESVAKCPWQWFAERQLKLTQRSDADDLMEPSVRGTVLHEALHRFFETAKKRQRALVYLKAEDESWALPLLENALDSAWAHVAASVAWLGPEPLQQVARDEMWTDLQAYLAYEIKWNENTTKGNSTSSKQVQTAYEFGELKFDKVPINAGGVHFLLRGTIDRVDRGVDERVAGSERYIAAIDYKSSKGSTPAGGDKKGWDDGVVLQVPLYVAALRHMYPASLVSRLEYRTLRSPAAVHMLTLAPVKKGKVEDASAQEAQLAGALDAAGARVAQVREGTLPAAPAASCGCSPFCPARDICRIPGGPRETGW